MSFYADLHIHSKYSRATSRDCDLEHLSIWARKKGIHVIGTGDFTHPAWRKEIQEKLEPAEPGLFRLKPEIEQEVEKQVGGGSSIPTRFLLSVEISTIYKKGEKTRKVHHLILVPDFEKAEHIVQKLSKIGNLHSDGRPILGLDSRHLLEIALEAGEGSCLIPAHIWTPWFSALGSKSGFDSIQECYGDLAPHIFAVETGLSSDPEMNWRVSSLDRYRLVSNSDAHSPRKLGREACEFSCEKDYFSIQEALRTGQGYNGTVEFFPEEGKYHLDGHRKCDVRFTPSETREHGGSCPVCGKPVTVGVLNRVDHLADRAGGEKPQDIHPFQSFIPLPEVVSELEEVGPNSKRVAHVYENLLSKLGDEYSILSKTPLEDIRQKGSELLAEGIDRMRKGKVISEGGFDGEYGVIRVFSKDEIQKKTMAGFLFENSALKSPIQKRKIKKPDVPTAKTKEPFRQVSLKQSGERTNPLNSLDKEQRKAAQHRNGPLLILAGPGTGKTRALTHRIAYLISKHKVNPQSCLAITFTRRAANEMKERLELLIPKEFKKIPVFTFHALGLMVLREQAKKLELEPNFRVVSEKEKRDGKELLHFQDLLELPLKLFEQNPKLTQEYSEKFRWVSVDEFQDIDENQYRFIQFLASQHGNLCVIGDPNQSIYSFRGSDVKFFNRFTEDFPKTKTVRLRKTYRLSSILAEASHQVISSKESSQERLESLLKSPERIWIRNLRTEKAEAESVIQTIEQLLGGHSFFSLDSGRSSGESDMEYTFGDFAVLYRMDSQAEALVEAFERSGIPYQRHSHKLLIERPYVQKLMEHMQKTITKGSVLQRLRTAADELFQKNSKERDIQRILDATVALLGPFAAQSGMDFQKFMDQVSLGSETDVWDPRAERVSLLTIHASKGLEFPVVFMVGCEEGVLPLKFGSKVKAKDVEEEQRLFYVGMTRTKDRLILSHCAKRMFHGKLQELPVSSFVKEIEERLLERKKADMPKRSRLSPDQQISMF